MSLTQPKLGASNVTFVLNHYSQNQYHLQSGSPTNMYCDNMHPYENSNIHRRDLQTFDVLLQDDPALNVKRRCLETQPQLQAWQQVQQQPMQQQHNCKKGCQPDQTLQHHWIYIRQNVPVSRMSKNVQYMQRHIASTVMQ